MNARTDRPLPELRQILRSALMCDALDALGARQSAIHADLRPLDPLTVMVGRAFPVTTVSVQEPPEQPYVGLLAALDALGPDDVYVISAGGRDDVALWGELLTTAALAAGAAGAVCAGCVRDTAQIRGLRYPCFAAGVIPYDINGRLEVTGHGRPVELAGMTVRPGQLIVGDVDGVVVVPPELEAEAVESAVAKAQDESAFRDAVARGMPASTAFATYRVL